MLVTELVELDKKRIRVLLEGGESFVLYRGEVKNYSIREGEELPPAQYGEIRSEVLTKRAKKRAMHLLEKMDRTEAQLRAKLKQGFYPEDIVDEAIAYVKSCRYLDDARYAENYVQGQKGRKSQRRIYMDLLGKGIPKSLITQALEEGYQAGQEQELILKWVQKKGYSSSKADLKEKQKMYQSLLRKGFHSDDILHVLDYLT